MFMLKMHSYVHGDMRQRIYEICTGHLRWVSHLDATAAFSSNIWIDGRDVGQSDTTDLPHNSPVNMPSHIIKATEYLKTFEEAWDLEFVCHWLGEFAGMWFDQLIKTKNHLTPIWQHSAESEIPKYRMSDHVWIWKALRNLEDLVVRIEKMQNSGPHSKTLKEFLSKIKNRLYIRGVRRRKTQGSLNFDAESIRRQNLRRFSLFNDVVRAHTLSVTRSARETRFLLHDSDTVLYYGKEWKFFDDEEKGWTGLIDSQCEHDKDCNDESEWDSLLRYGLAIEMASQGHEFDQDFPASEMLPHAKAVILNSSSENGLLPGLLNQDKEPMLFEREIFRDFYFHVGFEVPYILLRAAERARNSESHSGDRMDQYSKEGTGFTDSVQVRPQRNAGIFIRTESRSWPRYSSPPRDIIPGRILTGHMDLRSDGQALTIEKTLKRQNPYGRLMDLSNIVEVPEEWLCRYPDFLDYIPCSETGRLANVIEEASTAISKEKETFLAAVDQNSGPHCQIQVFDIRKSQRDRKSSDKHESKVETRENPTYRGFWHHLKSGRSAEASKKRLIYLQPADYSVATICYVVSPEREREHMALFFDRHAKVNTSYFYDDTEVAFNNWVTEVHFRFFRFMNTKTESSLKRQLRSLAFHPCSFVDRKAFIAEEVISFRIVGDFFDRYWTCHIIQTSPDEKSFLPDRLTESGIYWHQRKVLELILLNEILKNVSVGMDVILGKLPMGTTPDPRETIFPKESFEDRKHDELVNYFQLLVYLRANLISAQGLVEQWNNRESARGRGRPRWTRQDEEKYRKAINEKLRKLEDCSREIKKLIARIDLLTNWVTDSQEASRSKKSLKQAENITLFTYVTLFFLPAGLAASIFSMNGVPDHTIIAYMIATTAVALSITVLVLWWLLGQDYGTMLHGVGKILKLDKNPKKLPQVDEGGNDHKWQSPLSRSTASGWRSRLKHWRKSSRETHDHVDDPAVV